MTCVTDECETLVVDPTEVEKIPLNWAAIVGSSLLIVVCMYFFLKLLRMRRVNSF